mgnify:CR=1 FL=1
MGRFALWVFALMALGAAACGDGGGAGGGRSPEALGTSGVPGEPPRPAAVQADARFVALPLTLGSIERRPNASPAPRGTRLIAAFSCEDNVFLIRTDNEDIWSLIPCDRVTPLSQLEPYRQEPAAIKMDPLAGKLRLETLSGAQAEFTVEATWVYERPR